MEAGSSGQNVRSVEEGRAEMAFTQADVAYAAYRRGADDAPHPFGQLRGVAVLWVNTVHVAVPTGSPLRTVADLRGRRVAVGTHSSGTETLAHIVLESFGLGYGDLSPTSPASRGPSRRCAPASPMPASSSLACRPTRWSISAPARRAHAAGSARPRPGDARPVPLPRAGGRPGRHLRGQAAAVETVGVRNLLLCRQDLDETLVYRLTRAFFEALPQLAEAHPAAGLIDPEQAPATPIPLHPGAARYYREREITQ